MQASRPTSQADQLCPVRKPAASEHTTGLTVLFWAQSKKMKPAPALGQGWFGEEAASQGQDDREGEATFRLDPEQESKEPPLGHAP